MKIEDRKLNANKIFACQEMLSEVALELNKYNDTREIAFLLSKLNNQQIDFIRVRLLEMR